MEHNVVEAVVVAVVVAVAVAVVAMYCRITAVGETATKP